MEHLFEQEELHFQPEAASFDVAAIGARITQIGFTFQDESDPAVFVVANDAESRDEFARRRRENPSGGFPFVLLIRVEPDRVTVYQGVGGEFLTYSREFVGWLLAEVRCRVSNESGTALDAT